MSLVEQLRGSAALTLDDRIVSAIPGGEPDSGTSQERYKLWRESQNGKRPTEYLLPRIVRRGRVRLAAVHAPGGRRGRAR